LYFFCARAAEAALDTGLPLAQALLVAIGLASVANFAMSSTVISASKRL